MDRNENIEIREFNAKAYLAKKYANTQFTRIKIRHFIMAFLVLLSGLFYIKTLATIDESKKVLFYLTYIPMSAMWGIIGYLQGKIENISEEENKC